MSYAHITKRADFLRCAKGRKAARPSLVLQMWRREDDGPLRVGFTASKKVGNAVLRNRAKRRLRAAVAEILVKDGLAGRDYVLIARASTPASDFSQILQDVSTALQAVERPRK